MHNEAKKLYLIEKLLKVSDEAILAEVEVLLTKDKSWIAKRSGGRSQVA